MDLWEIYKASKGVPHSGDLYDALMGKALGGGSAHEETSTTGVFETDISRPLRKLLLTMNPIQSGSGDPSPSNVRPIEGCTSVIVKHTGKNLYNKTLISGDILLDNLAVGKTYTATADVNNPSTATYFYIRRSPKDSETKTVVGYVIAGTTISPATFTVEEGYNYWAFSNNSRTNVINIQIEEGSEATEYEPYQRQTYSASFPALGKNLLDFNALKTAPEGEMQGASSTYTVPHVLDMALEPNTAYTVSTDYTKSGSMQNIVYVNRATSADAVYSGHDITVATGADGNLKIGFFDERIGSEYFLNGTSYLQVEKGTATSYEPYTNAVYGGILDMVSGVLTVEYASLTFDGTQEIGNVNWRPNTNSCGWLYKQNITPNIITEQLDSTNLSNIKSDRLKTIRYSGNSGIYGNDESCISAVGGTTYGVAMRVEDTSLTTANAVNAWLAQNPVQVVYKLATPQTYQLTPQQITTLVGTNVITSDADVTEVVYLTRQQSQSLLMSSPLSMSNTVQEQSSEDPQELSETETDTV